MKECCESGHLPLQEFDFGGQNLNFTVPAIGKRAQQQLIRFAGPSLCGVKRKIQKKTRILAGLLDKSEPERIQQDQQ